MINEEEYHKRVNKILDEIRLIESNLNHMSFEEAKDWRVYKKGLEYCYNIMKQIGIYK